MEEIQWKYVSPLSNEKCIADFEKEYSFILPEDLKNCIVSNNAGSPTKNVFDLPKEKGKVFGALLSFNKDEPDNVYENLSLYKDKKAMPFAIDPAGNLICLKDNKIVFYDHELDEFVDLAETFTEFIAKLHN